MRGGCPREAALSVSRPLLHPMDNQSIAANKIGSQSFLFHSTAVNHLFRTVSRSQVPLGPRPPNVSQEKDVLTCFLFLYEISSPKTCASGDRRTRVEIPQVENRRSALSGK